MKDIARIGMSSSEIRYCNSKIMEILSLYLNILPDAITPEIVNEISKSCNIPVREAYAQAFAAVCELNIDREDKGFFYNYILPMLTERDPREFENDPYYKNIKIPDGKTGSWELRSKVLKPCEAFVCGDFNDDPMSYTYFRMSRGRKDSFREAGHGFAATFARLWPVLRIDYIMLPDRFDALEHSTPRVKFSDHYPVVSTIEL